MELRCHDDGHSFSPPLSPIFLCYISRVLRKPSCRLIVLCWNLSIAHKDSHLLTDMVEEACHKDAKTRRSRRDKRAGERVRGPRSSPFPDPNTHLLT